MHIRIGALDGPRNLLSPEEKLWKVWWLWGVPVAWITSALVLLAEELRMAGLHSAGNLLDVAKLAVYWYWCRLAWRCSGNVGNPVWTFLSKGALAVGLGVTVLI
jgi:hypothetical protein